MKDYIGKDIKVGDRVVRGRSGRYGGFCGLHYVHGFTPQMLKVSQEETCEDLKLCENAHPENCIVVTTLMKP